MDHVIRDTLYKYKDQNVQSQKDAPKYKYQNDSYQKEAPKRPAKSRHTAHHPKTHNLKINTKCRYKKIHHLTPIQTHLISPRQHKNRPRYTTPNKILHSTYIQYNTGPGQRLPNCESSKI